jgi:hypothetical protein
MLHKTLSFMVGLFCLAQGMTAYADNVCSGKPNTSSEIAGSYFDNWGGIQIINKDFWLEGGLVGEICKFDDKGRYFITLNHPRDPFNPSKFSRFDWTRYDGRLWFCHTVFNASTEADAMASPPAVGTNPGSNGCGSFPWTSIQKLPQ